MSALFNAISGQTAVQPTRGQTNPPPRILVVDDDIDLRLLSADVLVRSGYQVDTAEDGATGWETLLANNYDLLITDNNMPKLSGVELVKKLRSEDVTVPVILTSGAMPTEELNRHPWLQLAATLVKPFSIGQLLGTVEKVLRAVDSTRSRSESYFPKTGNISSQQIQ